MANKKNFISVGKMDEIMEERFPGVELVDYYGEELAIKKVIPFDMFSAIVRQVSNVCFDKDTGEFESENMEFAIRLCVVNTYTNVRMPDNTEHQYQLLYLTDLWDTVMHYINHDQYSAMVKAINESVYARNNANRAMFEHAVNNVVSQIAQVGEQLSGLLGSVSPDDVKNLVSAIGNGGIDEGKIVKAVVAEQNKLRQEDAGSDPDNSSEDISNGKQNETSV